MNLIEKHKQPAPGLVLKYLELVSARRQVVLAEVELKSAAFKVRRAKRYKAIIKAEFMETDKERYQYGKST